MPASKGMDELLRSLGCRKRIDDYVLDCLIGTEYYLRFDAAEDLDRPQSAGTVDIYVVPVTKLLSEGLRVVIDCDEIKIMRFMYALGIEHFNDQTRQVLATWEE